MTETTDDADFDTDLADVVPVTFAEQLADAASDYETLDAETAAVFGC